jgi:vancomycin resistance protein YoaR|tara:strand:- start:290 stop:1621 length:1332 start_codon:yes stop_codon:yes gene_type:complete
MFSLLSGNEEVAMWKFQIPVLKFQYANRLGIWLLAFGILFVSSTAEAASYPITYRYNHHLFELQPYEYSHWKGQKQVWSSHGKSIRPLAEFRVDGDQVPPLPAGVVRHIVVDWDKRAMRETLKEKISLKLDREPGAVTIKKTGTGVLFEGIGMLGRKVDLDLAVELTIKALENEVTDVVLPVIEIQPQMEIDIALRKMGIREVITVGESDYSGSPYARRLNIANGLSKFNGTVIEKGEIFSFNETLGPVNSTTGYYKELVILGERTLPEYGGGLCQVSTTAYRGIWEYGFPIEKRRNHSFAVMYYSPQGTDATIYPPHTDMKFANDSPGALLIQTYNDAENRLAYYIYYGTNDNRESEIIGPYVWGRRSAPADKVEYTTAIAPGTTRKAGGRVPGLKAVWYRVVNKGGKETVEPFFSYYEARPNLLQIGVSDMPGNEPSWIGN